MFLMINHYAVAQTVVSEYTTNFYDTQRNRIIPVAVYAPQTENRNEVIIFNHGYGANKGGDYKIYSHITKALAANGYFVISIQHELPTDDLLAMEGDLYKNRLPNWERGVQNILFTITEFKKLKPQLNWSKLTLIGHSNGGDMAALFATTYPDLLNKVISLDNRRMPLPRTKHPNVYSIRGSDYPADDGVIPGTKEQKELAIKIVYPDNIRHTDMDDKASEEQSRILNGYIMEFLKE